MVGTMIATAIGTAVGNALGFGRDRRARERLAQGRAQARAVNDPDQYYVGAALEAFKPGDGFLRTIEGLRRVDTDTLPVTERAVRRLLGTDDKPKPVDHLGGPVAGGLAEAQRAFLRRNPGQAGLNVIFGRFEPPENPELGTRWLDSSCNLVKRWDGNAWVKSEPDQPKVVPIPVTRRL